MAVTYLLGASAKGLKNCLQNAIDKRDDRKESESRANLPTNDQERKRYNATHKRRERGATISLVASVFGILLLFVFMFVPCVAFVIVGTFLLIPSILYGLWYSFFLANTEMKKGGEFPRLRSFMRKMSTAFSCYTGLRPPVFPPSVLLQPATLHRSFSV